MLLISIFHTFVLMYSKEKCQLKTIKGIDNSSFSHEMTEKYLSDGDAKVSENGKNPNDFSDVEIGKKSDQKAAYIPGIVKYYLPCLNL